MSTIAPDQLPTPTTVRPSVVPPPPVWNAVAQPATLHAAPATRRTISRTTRLSIVGAVLTVVVLGGAALTMGGDDTTASNSDRRGERSDRTDPDTTTEVDPGTNTSSIDVAGSYQAMFGVAASAATLECLTDGVGDVESAVQSVIAGTPSGRDEVETAMTPFAECASDDDYASMVLTLATNAVQPSSLDQQCALSVFNTFTAADRLGVLVDSYMDPNQFIQRLFDTFTGCAA